MLESALTEGMKSVPALVVILIFLGWALRLVITGVRGIVSEWLGTLTKIGEECHSYSESREERMKTSLDGMNAAMHQCADARVEIAGALGRVDSTMKETNRLLVRANGRA